MNPANTPPVISRGKHETYGGYWSRTPARLWARVWGRHEVRTPGKGFASRAPWVEGEMETIFGPAKVVYPNVYGEVGVDTTGHFKGSISHFDKDPTQARIERYEHMGDKVLLADEDPPYGGPHPPKPIKHCPYLTDHKPGCSWQDGPAWIETGIKPDKPTDDDITMARFFAANQPTDEPVDSKDGTPDWAYDEDDYCVCCGNGRWKYHMPECELRDALDK